MKTPDGDRSPVAAAALAGGGASEFEADLWLSVPPRAGRFRGPRSDRSFVFTVVVFRFVLHVL